VSLEGSELKELSVFKYVEMIVKELTSCLPTNHPGKADKVLQQRQLASGVRNINRKLNPLRAAQRLLKQ
jgi:hypothetical protein